MGEYAVSIYDAFSAKPFGGSQAALVMDAGELSVAQRHRVARELGLPATAFVSGVDNNRVTVQFISTVMELPMCGHGTVCLVTHLVEQELLKIDAAGGEVVLDLPGGQARVEVNRYNGRPHAMLAVTPAQLESGFAEVDELVPLLGIPASGFHPILPRFVARGDFVHLLVPVRDLASMQAIDPDFAGITDFCRGQGLETVVTFSMDTEQPDMDVHVRDFCPAVGVPESAAAGTSNAALACYLVANKLVQPDKRGMVEIVAEQGMELGRPSAIHTRIFIDQDSGAISCLQVGGVATRVLVGTIKL